MTPKRTGKGQKDADDPVVDEIPLTLPLTPNQVVGFNLARAREWRGWTQQQAADALAPYLGKQWSKASVSQAERSIAGRFIRQFTADEIVAFARAFDLPLGWFFLPPPPWADQPRVPVTLAAPDGGELGIPLAELVDLLFGTEQHQALLAMALQQWLQQHPAQLTAAQDRVTRLVRHRIDALAHHSLRQLGDWQTMLRSMANQLEDLEARAERAAAKDLDDRPS